MADAYDAITSDRPYRKGSTPYEAREILEGKAGHEFDPEVIAAFSRAFRKQQMDIPDLWYVGKGTAGPHLDCEAPKLIEAVMTRCLPGPLRRSASAGWSQGRCRNKNS